MSKKDTVTTEEITDINTLLDIYKQLPGNSNVTLNDFYRFLSIDSAERTNFLVQYCDYSYTRINKTYILKVKPKTE